MFCCAKIAVYHHSTKFQVELSLKQAAQCLACSQQSSSFAYLRDQPVASSNLSHWRSLVEVELVKALAEVAGEAAT